MILSFEKKVYNIVRKIPKGKVMTYKQVAQLAGKPRAYRAVGNILNKNYNLKIPCHRVIRSDGKIGGYNRGAKKKATLLGSEKVIIRTLKAFIVITDKGGTYVHRTRDS